MSLKPLFAAVQSTDLSTGLDGLASGAGVSSAEIDNSTDLHKDALISIHVAGASASTGYVSVYIQKGAATGATSTTEVPNMDHVCDVQLNGTTAVDKTKLFKDLPKYYKIRLVNSSGVALAASGNTVKRTGVNYQDV
ncbi:hypothetical protein [Nitrosomonas marina]|uniref:Uncharacterized protein n=1 Tax=Nitrosomonas marina TaxID=917 RepID=A0A1H8IRK2_9PROT|nr:hypothetical protein [Nitrosomonas marina]SEN71283.1 hypothetical protein SAMN05216325_13914 [Nitrosomonas marina]